MKIKILLLGEDKKENSVSADILLEVWIQKPGVLYPESDNNLKKAEIILSSHKEGGIAGSGDTQATKEISIEYSNSSEYNENDKKAVENVIYKLDLPKNSDGQYEIIEYVEVGEDGKYNEFVQSEIENAIRDKSISIKCTGAMGDASMFNVAATVYFAVFRNDVHYIDLTVSYKMIPEIVIPSNIKNTEEACMDYATKKLQSYVDNRYQDIDNKYTYSLREVDEDNYEVICNELGEETKAERVVIKKYGSSRVHIDAQNAVICEKPEGSIIIIWSSVAVVIAIIIVVAIIITGIVFIINKK